MTKPNPKNAPAIPPLACVLTLVPNVASSIALQYFVLPKLQAQPTPPRDWRKNIPKSFRKRGTTPWIPAALKEQADEIIEMLNITNEDRQAFFPAMLSIINFFRDL